MAGRVFAKKLLLGAVIGTSFVVLAQQYYSKKKDPTEVNSMANKKIVVGITSQKDVKVKPVKNSLTKLLPPEVEIELLTFKSDSGIANNPVGEEWGIEGAKRRILNSSVTSEQNKKDSNSKATESKDSNAKPIDYWVSIENYVRSDPKDPTNWLDIAAVVIKNEHAAESKDQYHVTLSRSVSFPTQFANATRDQTSPTYAHKESGWEPTVGQILQQYYKEKFSIDVDDSDWHRLFGQSRAEIIEDCVFEAVRDFIVPSVNMRLGIKEKQKEIGSKK
jgi:non-canonical (house-cleaning) NTP pyrophosphatase